MKLQSVNPATGELIESFEEISDAELEAALAAHDAGRDRDRFSDSM